jgi:hypothetical protein
MRKSKFSETQIVEILKDDNRSAALEQILLCIEQAGATGGSGRPI